MGFPSPAIDYIEQRLTVTSLCHFDANCRTIQTSAGYAVVDLSRQPNQGDHVLASLCGSTQFAVIRGRALITSDGEAIEGEALNDVVIRGVVTFLINRANSFEDDPIPVI
ncbi:hypothetical protein FML24_27355 [Klebsiella oxytoca]|uniref:hypothetical protein n=1 Tax=Klebsiella oxytoca TaxID=571 RepID=UPI000FDA4270|nr:hypothetical protein [Klebsiella oxytoca]MBZ7697000.1 hypothetical protein [Klebsiella oxytoca]RVT17838.1 hypothetical protein EOK96_16530 [Klebsiella oxytoca]HED2047918.1 hypothetical protein [Klebsiella oxytoca]